MCVFCMRKEGERERLEEREEGGRRGRGRKKGGGEGGRREEGGGKEPERSCLPCCQSSIGKPA